MEQWLIIIGAIAFAVIGLKKFSPTTKLRTGVSLLLLGILSLFISTQMQNSSQGFSPEMSGKGIAMMLGIFCCIVGSVFLVGSIGKKKSD